MLRSDLRVSHLRPLSLPAAVLGLVAALVLGLTMVTSAVVQNAVASDSTTDPALAASGDLADATRQAAVSALSAPTTEEQLTEHADRARAEEAARKKAAAAAARKKAAAEAARKAADERTAAAERAARSQTKRAVADPKSVARSLLGGYGWGSDQFSCLDKLWTKESNWKHTADNPTSSAYGIPQALPGSKMASAGADWETNPVTQIKWGLGYIEDVYGSPCAAWGHSQAANWY